MSMTIGHNLGAMNALSALNSNSNALNSALQQLSTGKRINSAADDASGYAISQKMQGQINGLNQASSNAQDGISMIQTASGALSQTTSILQQMRQLAVQASNSTATNADRADLQTEFNQLASQINNISNTTQFNTQNLLSGNGQENLSTTGLVTAGTLGAGTAGVAASTTQASDEEKITGAAAAGDTFTATINGQQLQVTFAANNSSYNDDAITSSSGNAATINLPSGSETANNTASDIANALTTMISQNSTLKGQYTAVADSSGNVTIQAVKGGQFDGAAGSIAVAAAGTGIAMSNVATGTKAGANNAATQASNTVADFSSITTAAETSALVGKGFTINGQEIQFYNADNGPYTGTGIGVNLSDAIAAPGSLAVANAIVSQVGSQLNGVTLSNSSGALVATAIQGGTSGNSISFSDGGSQQDFEATFQIGANSGQTMSVNIGDASAKSLGITSSAGTAGYSSTDNVNNGTNSTNVEAALDITTTSNADSAINTIDNAIQTVTTEQSNLGAVQNRLTSTISNLSSTSQNLTTAESGITDTDMASEMATFTQDNVLQQAAVSMLAQANQQPQLVLKLLG
ncbi:flagellin N-terminal helical domain-containing protein [Alicyclobacillus fastidiosus]|uniref:Flagellin n=1 Tax=Alicyclobacillus fastidiosus TaxID=392011 RepID=A0ABV5AKS0_9BACL|nr:flagellin [Alicyclobacillus fastidiosus]WEH10250.1 flagellin [Alicyclobacillus fastidiosus]